MDDYTEGLLGRQVSSVWKHRQQIVEYQDLCFTKLLPKEQVEASIARHHVRFRQRLYTPLVTIWTFLYQVLAPDQSCRAAVARLPAFLCVNGDGPASAKTDPYCKARQRLPENLLADLARSSSGVDLQRQVPSTGLLNGRPIKIADGTTVSMPDTPENQRAYPQQPGQKKGLGFPIMRLAGLISLSCGAVLDHFHLVKWFNEKLSLLRRHLYRQATEMHKAVLKGSRWLLLKAPENLKAHDDPGKDERIRLQAALELNQPLAAAYYMKERLRLLFRSTDRDHAATELKAWIQQASHSGTKILKDAARKLSAWKPFILNWHKHPLSTGQPEVINGKVKTLQRNAYGYRDEEYLKLRIFNLHKSTYSLTG